jgi:DNA-binding response OmpR family regulator
MKKILIIEDDTHIANMLNDLLGQQGYSIKLAYSGTEGLMCFKQEKFDLILLDLMLPGKDGMAVLEEIRTSSTVPVIMLTAVDSKDSAVSLLYAGANDYLTKPFYANELLARIEVQLRMGGVADMPEDGTLHFKDIILDLDQYDAFIKGSPLSLSKREFEILKCLMKNPKKVFTKNNLYETVWQDEFYGDDNTINVHVSNIRTKMAMKNPHEDYIQTVWGIGYKMQE